MRVETVWRSPTRRGLLLASAALTLSACAGNIVGPPSPSPKIYVLNPAFAQLLDAPSAAWQLVVAIPSAPASFDTERIALETAPNTMDYYANSQWPDRVPVLVQSLLVEAFEKSGKIAAAGRDTAGIRGDYILETDIRDFEAYYAAPDIAPQIRVNIAAKLIGALSHEVATSTQTQGEAQAAANNMASITAAFTQAAQTAVERIVSWTLDARLPKPAV